MSIHVSCPHCRRPYRLHDRYAGRRVKCRDCGQPIAVPGIMPPATETTPSGVSVYRYAPREQPGRITSRATSFLSDISRHIERTIGPAPMVFHEIVSPDVHLDLHVVPPTHRPPDDDHPFGTDHYTVITSGLSSGPMTLPAGAPPWMRYAELMITLPADWPGLKPDGTFDSDIMKDESHWWPFRWLKNVARLPHMYNTYIGPGHTIPNGDPPEPFAPGAGFCCMLVCLPLHSPAASKLIINDDIAINFYALWPIYLEEMNLKLEKGMDAILDKLEAAEVTDLISPGRPNTCRRKGWLFGR